MSGTTSYNDGKSIMDRLSGWLNWKRFFFLLFLFMFLATILFPFYWMVSSSFKSQAEIAGREPVYIPSELRPDAYLELFDPNNPNYQNFGQAIRNSLIISIPTSLIAVTLSTLGAYAIARLTFRGKGVMLNGIL